MKVHVEIWPNGVLAYLLWPAGPAGPPIIPTHEMSKTDLRFLLRWEDAVLGPNSIGYGRTTAVFRWAVLAPLLTELDA